MSGFDYQKSTEGIVVVTMDQSGLVNKMDAEYVRAMAETVARLESEEGLTGVILTSAKDTFFAGGDLQDILAFQPGDESAMLHRIESIKGDLRRLERLGVPVVAAINGAALGGGLEICLACHRRIAVADKSVVLGLPEVTLGLLPGGGVVRLVRLLGLQAALPYLLEGTKLSPEQAVQAGLIDEIVTNREELIGAARRWLMSVQNDASAAQQPWDTPAADIPGGDDKAPANAQLIATMPAIISRKTRGLLPAPEQILACAVEALKVDVDTALRVESRRFLYLMGTPQAKNLVTAYLQSQQIRKNRTTGRVTAPVRKVGILGAGTMGQGIAYVTASAGIEVVLKDLDLEAAQRGKQRVQALLDRRVSDGKLAESRRNEVLGFIQSGQEEDLAGCDLIIEAVFEELSLKQRMSRELEKHLHADGFWASNTSSLPIGQLAEASEQPDRFIGLHFFSPVDRMPLVEIIRGPKTSDETLARALDFVRVIGKTAIVVNDSLGFYTSRVFGTTLDEGVRLLHEGVHPVRIDALGQAAGMPVGPLALSDEVSQVLNLRVHRTWESMGRLDAFGEQAVWREVLATMVDEYGRGGRRHGGGFYQYPEGESKFIWPTVLERYYRPDYELPDQDIRDRLLFRPVLEALRCLEEGVVDSVVDANVGSLLGIGAPAWTGGYIQFVNTFGLAQFIERCNVLTERYGERFSVPARVGEKLRAGQLFL